MIQDNGGIDEEGEATRGGSFSVTAPHATLGNSRGPPQGNRLFPALCEAIFGLEAAIAPKRQPSTHCAVNRDARFSPHVDSGRGLGQSLSCIVGLGEYEGGGLCVEGTLHECRYQPVEFDGWRERHWTLPFRGERFSLVWFTPHDQQAGATPA